VLKLVVDWRPRRLPDLVECLHKVVATQMADLRHALHSESNFEVSSTFGKYVVADSVWRSLQLPLAVFSLVFSRL